MIKRLTSGAFTLGLLLLFGHFNGDVYAGRIELDNSASTSSTQLPALLIHLPQFSRFSLTGDIINQGSDFVNIPPPTQFGTGEFGPRHVFVNTLSDYGITAGNLAQAGSLIQIQFVVSASGSLQLTGTGGSVTVFLIDPANINNRINLSTLGLSAPTVGNSASAQALFNLSQFGSLPFGVTPDFYIGTTGNVGFNGTGVRGDGSITILSNVAAPAAVPEPTSLVLLVTGLSLLKGSWSRRLRT